MSPEYEYKFVENEYLLQEADFVCLTCVMRRVDRQYLHSEIGLLAPTVTRPCRCEQGRHVLAEFSEKFRTNREALKPYQEVV